MAKEMPAMSNLLERETVERVACGFQQGPVHLTFAGDELDLNADEAAMVGEVLGMFVAGRMVTPRDEMLSPSDAARFLGVSRPTIYNWIQAGLLADVPVGRHHRIPMSSAQALYDERLRRADEAHRLMQERPEDPRVIAARERAQARLDALR